MSDISTITKAVGIGVMWLLILLISASLGRADYTLLLRFGVGAACVESVLAFCESALRIPFVRQFITGSATTNTYVVRPNLILGGWINRAQGTVGYPIPFSAVLVVAALIVVFSGAITTLRWKLVILGLLGTAILFSGTRSALVALAIGLAIGFVPTLIRSRSNRGHKFNLWLFGGLTAALAAGAITYLVLAIVNGDFSVVHRGTVVDEAWSLTRLPPLRLIFGSGYDSTQRLYAEGFLHVDSVAVVDNAFITQVVTSGLVGLAALVLAIVVGLKGQTLTGRVVIASLVTFMFSFDVFSWHLITFLLIVALGTASRSRTVTEPDFSSPGIGSEDGPQPLGESLLPLRHTGINTQGATRSLARAWRNPNPIEIRRPN
jgi:hypothetical protein